MLIVLLWGCVTPKRLPREPVGARSPVQTANDLLKVGKEKFYHDEYKQALVDFESAAKLSPDNPEVLSARAMAKSALKDFPGAYADFQLALKLNPKLPEFYYDRGLARRRDGDFYGSLQDLNIAIALRPTYAEAINARGNTYVALREYAEAITDYTQAIALSPHYRNAFMNRGNALRQMGDYAAALLDLDIAVGLLKMPPPWVYLNRAQLLIEMKQYARAEADIRKAMDIQPEFGPAYGLLGDVHMHYGKLKEACADFDRGIARDPGDAGNYLERGLIHEMLNQDEKAAKDLQKAAEMPGDNKSPEIEDLARLHWNLLTRRTTKADAKVHLEKPWDLGKTWPTPVVEYMLGTRSEASLLAAAKNQRWPSERQEAECSAFYFIGMNHLLAGRRAEAVRYLLLWERKAFIGCWLVNGICKQAAVTCVTSGPAKLSVENYG